MTHEDERWTERVQRAYREAPLEAGSGRERLLERLRSEPAPVTGAVEAGAWTAHNRGWPSAFAIAAALVVFAGGGLTGWTLAHRMPALAAGVVAERVPAGERGMPVVFALPAPGARHVALVGDFNSWDTEATPLHRAALGDMWIVEVPLARGLHTYAFVVDGERWIPDPGAPLAPGNEFGARNSVVIVGESAS